jgi:hypothetical protein
MFAEDVPEGELTVGLEQHPKKLWRVDGKISLPVDADDPKWTHLFVEPREIKFPQRNARADLLLGCRDSRIVILPSVGDGKIHAEVQPLLALHDQIARADRTDLRLA